MRLLLDENISSRAAHELSQAGHDMLRVAAVSPSVDDEGVLALARDDSRTLVTFDSDFGDLIFKVGLKPPPGIIYLRMHPIESRLVAVRGPAAVSPQGSWIIRLPSLLRSAT